MSLAFGDSQLSHELRSARETAEMRATVRELSANAIDCRKPLND